MRYEDPLSGLAVRLRAAWAYDADASALDRACLRSWNGDGVEIHVFKAALPAVPDDKWEQAQAGEPVDVPWTSAPVVARADGTIVVRAGRADVSVAGAGAVLALSLPDAPPTVDAVASVVDGLDALSLERLARRLPPGDRLLAEAHHRQVQDGALDAGVAADAPAVAWAAGRWAVGRDRMEAAREAQDWQTMLIAARRLHDDLVLVAAQEVGRPDTWVSLCHCLSTLFGAALVTGGSTEMRLAAEALVGVADAVMERDAAFARYAAEARLRLARACLELGDAESAKRTAVLVGEARRLLARETDAGQELAHAAYLESFLRLRRGDHRSALEALQEAHRLGAADPQTLAQIAALEASVRALAGETPAVDTGTNDPETLVELANALMIGGRHDAALECAARALPAALLDLSRPLLPRVLMVAAAALQASDLPLAGAMALAAEAALDLRAMTLSEEELLAAGDDPLEATARSLLVSLLFASDEAAWGVAAADRARGRVSRARIARGHDIFPPDRPASPLPALVGDARERLRRGAGHAYLRIGELLAAQGDRGALTPAELQGLVDDIGAAVLMLHPVMERVALVVLAPGRAPHVEASPASAAELASTVAAMRQAGSAFGDPSAGATGRAAAADGHAQACDSAWTALVAPVVDRLPEGQLIVAPTGELGLIPFSALGPAGTALVDSYALALVPSLGVLAALRARRATAPSPQTALVVGEPKVPDELQVSLTPLPHARAEATDVAAALRAKGADVTLHLGAHATEDAYRAAASAAGVLHLACHAQVRKPAALSSLFLARGARDGLLTAGEIERIPISPGLAYLSCCESAAGRPSVDGVIGLARSFFLAGASAAVAALWRVDDLVAAEIARRFYDALLDGGASIAQALQHAVLATRGGLRAGRLADAQGPLPDTPLLWGANVAAGDVTAPGVPWDS